MTRFPMLCIVLLAACANHEQAVDSSQRSAGTLDGALRLAPASTAEARRILQGEDADGTGGPSPDGRLLSYTDWNAFTVNVRNLVTGETRVLAAPDSGRTQFPEYSRFSPDGRQLAYAWFNGEGYELRVVGTEGGAPRIVIPRDAENTFVWPRDWTVDEREILVFLYPTDGSTQLALVNVSTGKVRVLRTYRWDESILGSAALSPDGRYIAFGDGEKGTPKSQAIVVATLDGARQTRVINAAGRHAVIGWAADGRLFYTSEHDGSVTAYAVRMKNGRPVGESQVLKADFARAMPMGLTRDGRLFYSEVTGRWDVYTAGTDLVNARLLSPPARFGTVGRFNGGLDWTSDGKQSVYVARSGSRPNTSGVLAIRDEESGETRELELRLGYINGAIRWSPDGRSIVAVAADLRGRYAIRQIDARTGETSSLVELNPKGGMARAPRYSPDGRYLYYTLWDVDVAKDYRLMRRDLASDAEELVFAAPNLAGSYSLSYDGQSVAVITGGQGAFGATQSGPVISVVPAEGGPARELVRLPAKDQVTAIEWSRDNQHVLYARRGERADSEPDVWVLSVAGGEPKPLGLSMPRLMALRTHPDGRRLGFAGGESGHEVWVLESGLRQPRNALR